MSTIFMFSGQGSQYYHMGVDLYQNDPVFRKHFLEGNSLIDDVAGISIAEIIFAQDKTFSDIFSISLHSNLSLFLIELAIVKTLCEKGIIPDMFLGSSFGTLVASVAADCIGEEEAIDYLVQHGALFNDVCEQGCMLGVLASSDTYRSIPQLQNFAELAGTNFSNSYVLSLPITHLHEVKKILNNADITFQQLPVSRAYHSRWIDAAETRFMSLYKTLGSRQSTAPIICTSSELPLSEISAETFWRAIRGPMQFQNTINYLERSGSHNYIDIGPSGTLATFVKYALPLNSKSIGYPILSPFKQGMKNIENILAAI